MPLRSKNQKHTQFLTGVTSVSIGFGEIDSNAIDTDLSDGVNQSHSQLASSKAVKDYIDGAITVAAMEDTTIASIGDNHNFQYDSATSKWVNKTYIDFSKISAPSDPGNEEGRMYLKQIDAANNALAIKIQKAGNIVEVELTSPGCVCECGSTDGAKDPLYDFSRGKMVVELYCGHSYEMDIPNLRRIQ